MSTPTLLAVLAQAIRLYQGAIVLYAVMSWFAVGADGGIASVYRALGTICEPYIGLFRRFLPITMIGGAGFDWSPLVAILVLSLLQRVLYALL